MTSSATHNRLGIIPGDETQLVKSRQPLNLIWTQSYSHSSQPDSRGNPPKPRPRADICLVCRQAFCQLYTHKQYVRRLLRHESDRSRIPLHGIHDEKANPFASFPIPMNAELDRLYKQFFVPWTSDLKGLERHLFPIPRYKVIQECAKDDEATILALFSIVATQQSLMREGRVSDAALDLQHRVVAAQRRAFSYDPCSDARILTALVIMSNALAVDKEQDISTHLALIGSLVRQKGGIAYLGMSGVIADNLMYGDHLSAVTHNDLPKLSISGSVILCDTAPMAPTCYRDMSDQGLILSVVDEAASLTWVMVRIFDSACRPRGCTPSEARYFAYLANIVEFKLACVNAAYHDTDTVGEAITHACLITNHVLQRNYGTVYKIVDLLQSRLWHTLKVLRTTSFFAQHNLYDLEVWLSCIGSLDALRRKSRYEDDTVNFLLGARREPVYEIGTFHQLCNIMEKYGWAESVCITTYAAMWNRASRQDTPNNEVKLEGEIGFTELLNKSPVGLVIEE